MIFKCWLLLLLLFQCFLHVYPEIGDFEALNELINGAIIKLPDSSVSGGLMTVDLINLRCTNFEVGDIKIYSSRTNDNEIVLQLDIQNLDMICFADFKYDGLLFSGSGNAEVFSFDNIASTVLGFGSPNFSFFPPETLSVKSCDPTVNINDLNFDGGFLGFVLDRVESLLRNAFESQAEKQICKILREFSETRVAEMLQVAQDMLAEYPSDMLKDPLAIEKTFDVPENVNLFNFKNEDKETEFGVLFDIYFFEAVDFLSKVVEDPGGPTGLGSDMNINVLLRNLLDQDRAFTVDISTLDFVNNGKLYEGQDRLTKTTIWLNSVKLLGLDTFKNFEPVTYIGSQTLQTELSWDYLTFEFNVTFDIMPSTLDDSIITNPGSTNVIETVTIRTGIDGVKTVASLFLGIDQDILESLQLGSLLKIDKILSCFLSTIVDVAVSSLSLDFSSMKPPTLEGFVSSGIDRVVSNSVDAAYIMYEAALIEAVPGIFHVLVRESINKIVSEYVRDEQNIGDCSLVDMSGAIGDVDYRDLFLEPNQALAAGGTGKEPYGDLVSTVMPWVTEQFLTSDERGLSRMNSRIVQPLTKIQSGEEGKVTFTSDIVHVVKEDNTNTSWSGLLDRFEFSASNLSVQNIDTITFVSLFDSSGPHMLSNRIDIGPLPLNPLTTTVKLLLSVEGEDSPLAMRNELDIHVSIPSADLLLDVLAKISEKAFLEFPFRDIANHHCWLSTMANVKDNLLSKSVDPELELSRFILSLSALSSLDVSCKSCTSPGAEALSDMLDVWKQTSISSLFLTRFEELAEDIAQSLWRQLLLPMIIEAPKFCPHDPKYIKGEVATYDDFSEWNLPRSAVESIITALVIIIDMAAVAVAKNHILLPAEATDPLSDQSTLIVPEDSLLLDWTNLGDSYGSWSDIAFNKAREFLEEDFQLNNLVQKWLLEDDGSFNVVFDEFSFELAGVDIALAKIRIQGLDSLSDTSVFDAIAPQTFQNLLKFEKIGISIDVDIDSGNETFQGDVERLTHSVMLDDVVVSMASLVAMDMNTLGDTELGSLLNTEQLFPCVLAGLSDFSISQLLLTAGDIVDPDIDGFITSNLNETVSSIVHFFDAYNSDLKNSLPKISDTTVRDLINSFIPTYRDRTTSLCNWIVPNDQRLGLVDFRDLFLNESSAILLGSGGSSRYGNMFRTIFDTMNQQLLKIDSVDGSSINDLLGSWTKNQSNISGVITYPGDLLDVNSSLRVSGLQAEVGIKVSNLRVENVDSVGFIQLLQPLLGEANSLNNSVSLGEGSRPLRLSGTLLVSLQDSAEMQVRNEIDVSIDMYMLSITAAFLLRISEERLFSFPFRDMFNPNCWFATILSPSGFAVEHYAVLVEELGLNVSCISCTSTDFDDLLTQLYSPTFAEDASAFVNGTMGRLYKSDLLLNLINGFLDDAAIQCPHDPRFIPNATTGEYLKKPSTYLGMGFEDAPTDGKSIYFTVANCIIAGVLLILAILLRCAFRRRHNLWIKSLSSEATTILHREQAKEKAREDEMNKSSQSMFHCPHIPKNVRLAVPVILLANIALYLVAHLGVLSTMNIDVHLAGQDFTIYNFLQFSFIKSTVRTFHNGGREMAVLVFIFTGVWPYVKLLLSLVLWFLPPQRLSVSHRGNCLLWLDVWAKLSVVDIFTMLLAVGAFLIFIGGPADESFTSDGEFISIKAIVVPGPSFYCIVIAQRISRVSSRFLLDYHKFIVDIATRDFEASHGLMKRTEQDVHTTLESWEEEKDQFDEECKCEEDDQQVDSENKVVDDGCIVENSQLHHAPLYANKGSQDLEDDDSQHEFHKTWSFTSNVSRNIGNGIQLGGTIAVIFTFITVVCLFVIGCILAPAIAFDTKSIWGLAVESGKTYKEAVESYSVFRVVYQVLLNARFVLDTTGDYVGLGFLLTVGLVSALMFPLTRAIASIRKWLVSRRSNRERKRICSFGKKTSLPVYLQRTAWRHMEVYVISFVLACWQLGSVSAYAIHLYCDILGRIFDALAYAGLVEPTSAQCFGIQASLPGYQTIVWGSFLVLLVSFLVQAFSQYGKNKEYALRLLEEESLEILSSPSVSIAGSRRPFGCWSSIASPSQSFYDNESIEEGTNHGSESSSLEDCRPFRSWSSEASVYIGEVERSGNFEEAGGAPFRTRSSASSHRSFYIGDIKRISSKR